MTLTEKYWLSIFFAFLRYLSILMMMSGIVFIILGHYISIWFYMGLFSWPLLMMWGVVNLRCINAYIKNNHMSFYRL